MTAWFEPDAARWFAFFSLVSLLALTAPLAERGRYKAWVVGADATAIVLGLVLLGLAGIAALGQQPGYVIRPLLISGLVLTVVCAAVVPVLLRAYRDADHRRIAAKDL